MMPSMRQCELADPYILQLRVKLFIEFKKKYNFWSKSACFNSFYLQATSLDFHKNPAVDPDC